MVAFSAQLLDGAAPQAELDAELDQQGEVAKGDGLKPGDVGAGIATAAVALREAGRGQALGGQRPRPLQDALAVLGGGQGDHRRELGSRHDLAQLTADIGNIALLKLCGELGLIDVTLAGDVAHAYRSFRKMQHEIRLQGHDRARVAMERVARDAENVRRLWKEVMGDGS